MGWRSVLARKIYVPANGSLNLSTIADRKRVELNFGWKLFVEKEFITRNCVLLLF